MRARTPMLTVCAMMALLLSTSTMAADLSGHKKYLKKMRKYWQTQKAEPLRNGAGFIYAIPADSGLWTPGNIVVESKSGLRYGASKSRFFPDTYVSVTGNGEGDVTSFDSISSHAERDVTVNLEDVAGILELLGATRNPASEIDGKVKAEFERHGVQDLVISLPDAQLHRIGLLELELYMKTRASETVREILKRPDVHVVTAAVFAKSVELRFDKEVKDSGLGLSLGNLLGMEVQWRGERTASLNAKGVYVAYQTAHYNAEGGIFIGASGGDEAAGGGMEDSTGKMRDLMASIFEEEPAQEAGM